MSVGLETRTSFPRYSSIVAKRVHTQPAGWRRPYLHVPQKTAVQTATQFVFEKCFQAAVPLPAESRRGQELAHTYKTISALIVEYSARTASALIRAELEGGRTRLSDALKQELLQTQNTTYEIDLSGIRLEDPNLLLEINEIYPHLRALSLRGCGIGQDAYVMIGSLLHFSKLEALDLSDNLLLATWIASNDKEGPKMRRSPILDALSNLKWLTHLNLAKTACAGVDGLNAFDFNALQGHPSLRFLNLEDNPWIGNEEFWGNFFLGMPRLSTLVITDCPEWNPQVTMQLVHGRSGFQIIDAGLANFDVARILLPEPVAEKSAAVAAVAANLGALQLTS